jgi:hypothetical protein
MNNAIAILQIAAPGSTSLILQSNPNGNLEWHFSPRSGENSFGNFRYETVPVARIIFYDNRRRVVMMLYGVPVRPQNAFPFRMEDQRNNLSGELDVMGENLPLRVNTYTWSVRQAIPSGHVQTAR